MTAGKFADLVKEMRATQREWYRQHSFVGYDDPLSQKRRELETDVDRALRDREKRLAAEREAQQGNLFG